MKKKTIYEQPLNDRVRNLLKLEQLFAAITYHMTSPAVWDNRSVVSHMIELLDFLPRLDLKTEILDNLARYVQILGRWQQEPNVDKKLLEQLLSKAKHLHQTLSNQLEDEFEQLVSQHYLLNTIKQRSNIIAGTYQFDIPGYHYWLLQSAKQKQTSLADWFAPLTPIQEAIELVLYMLRNNTITTQETATEGFFQTKLDTEADYQLVRVVLPINYDCYPELSGGKQRITIRFFEQMDVRVRPLQTQQDVPFELCCCMM